MTPILPPGGPEEALGALSATARRTLEVIVVLDGVRDVETLGVIDGFPASLEDALGELRGWGLLAAGEPLRCACPVTAAAIGASIDDATVAGLRRRVLEVAIDAGTSNDVVVPLAAACPPTGDPLVVDLLAAAGDLAIRSNRGSDAVRLLRRALREPPDPVREVELRGRLALASVLVDEPGAATLVRRAARELDPVDGAHLARRTGVILAGRGRAREALALFEDLSLQLGTAAPEAASILELGWLAAARLDVSLRSVVRKRIAELVSSDQLDPSPSGRALAGLAAYELSLIGEERHRVVAFARYAVDHGTGASLTADCGSIWLAVLALLFADELDDAARALGRLERRGSQRDRDLDVLTAHHLRVAVERARGHLEKAQRSASVVTAAVRRGWTAALPGGAGNRCRLALLTGHLEGAEAELQLPGGTELYADDPSLCEYLDARGHLRSRQGRYAEALDDHLMVRCRHESLGVSNPGSLLWADGAARAMAALGRRAEALELLDDQLTLARRWGAARPIGALLTAAGTISPGREGEDLLEEAVDVLEGGVTPIELAEAHLALGRAAQQRDDLRRAERAARRAALVAGGAGATAIADAATKVLADIGRAGLADSPLGRLTRSELRVAGLASDGASNAEIAATLYVSRKAVEYHLSNVYRKLGIAGRSELPAAFDTEPW